jgi:hypothetical protein
MRSVTLPRTMRRGALVLAAAAVLVGVRMFSAAPAMADPLIITEPAQPVMNETIFDNGFVNFTDLDNGFVSVDHDLDHAVVDHDLDHVNVDNR